MNDPKATLLRPGWCDYTLIFGRKKFRFVGGEARVVPTAVALALRRKKDVKGLLFKIEDMPIIVTPANAAPKLNDQMPTPVVEKQNGLGEFRQGSLLECLSQE